MLNEEFISTRERLDQPIHSLIHAHILSRRASQNRPHAVQNTLVNFHHGVPLFEAQEAVCHWLREPFNPFFSEAAENSVFYRVVDLIWSGQKVVRIGPICSQMQPAVSPLHRSISNFRSDPTAVVRLTGHKHDIRHICRSWWYNRKDLYLFNAIRIPTKLWKLKPAKSCNTEHLPSPYCMHQRQHPGLCTRVNSRITRVPPPKRHNGAPKFRTKN